ncbi:MAG: hypothetical protein ABFS24_11945 [Pseudomonadota bacterium]
MKWIMQIMILVNLLTFAWYNFYHESYTGAEKKEFPEVPKGVKTLRLLSEREPVMDVSVHAQNQAKPVSMCHTIGPLKNHDLARDVLAEIKGLGREGNVRTDKQKVKYAYWVYLKSMPDDELEKIIEELEANGIKDYHQNGRNEISLGIYNGIQGAKRQQMNMAALGYSPLVGSLYRTEIQYWIDVADMNDRFYADDAWETYLARYPDSQLKSTRCDLINASAVNI